MTLAELIPAAFVAACGASFLLGRYVGRLDQMRREADLNAAATRLLEESIIKPSEVEHVTVERGLWGGTYGKRQP